MISLISHESWAKRLIQMLLLTFTVSSVIFLWFELSLISRASTILVTTANDELDAGGTLTNPLGNGLSLREAIAWMNTEDTANYVINFANTVSVISLTSALPPLSATCGTQSCEVSFVGENITLTGDGNFDALEITVDNVKVDGLNFSNFRHAIVIDAENITLQNLIVENSKDSQIAIEDQAKNVHIVESTVRSGDQSGLSVAGNVDTASWQKVKIYDNDSGNIALSSGANGGIVPPVFSSGAFFPNNNHLVVTGSGSQNGTIEFYLNNGETYLGTGVIDGTGHFSVTLPASDSEISSLPVSGAIIAIQTSNNRSSTFTTPVSFMPFDIAGSVTVDKSEISPQETASFQVILTNPLAVSISGVNLEADFVGLPANTLSQPQTTDSSATILTSSGSVKVNNITIPSGGTVNVSLPLRAGAVKKGENYQPHIRIVAPQEKVLSVPAVSVKNIAPEVSITPSNITVTSGSGVTLTGVISDLNNDQLNKLWTVESGSPAIILSSTNQTTTSFTAPQVTSDTTYTIKLKVDDGIISSETLATVLVKVGNLPPVLEPIDIPVVRAGKEVKLTVNASDPNNDRLTYSWRQTSGSGSIVFTGTGSNTIAFVAPKILTTTKYGFTVTVSDGKANVAGNAYVIVKQYRSESPLADAGPDQTVSSGTMVTLDGSKSKDIDSLVLTYLWEQVDGPKVTFAPTTIKTTFTTPTVTQDTVLEFRLTAKDGVSDGVDTVRVLVLPKGKTIPTTTSTSPSSPSPSTPPATPSTTNVPPVITIAAPTTAAPGEKITLDGSATRDPEGQKMRYFWRVTNQTLSINNFDKAKATIKIPDDFKNNGKIVVEFIVNDDKQQSKKTHEILVKGSAPVAATQAAASVASRDSAARTQLSSSPILPSTSSSPSPASLSPTSTLKRSDVVSQAQKACFPNETTDIDQKAYLDKVFLDMSSQSMDAVGVSKIDALRDALTACQVFPWKKRNEITTKDKESGFNDIPAVDNTNPNYWWARYARFSREHKLFKDKDKDDKTFEPTQPLTQDDLDNLLRKIQKLLDADYQYLPFYNSLKTLKTKIDTSLTDANSNHIPDFWEKVYGKEGTFKAGEDADADGLTNYQEYVFDTNPFKADSDGDDIDDAREAFLVHTDPVRFDTDNDGVSDYTELFVLDSNPREVDSDGDTFSDRFEGQDTNPNDDNSLPKDENGNGLPDDIENKKNISYTEDDDGDGLNDAWEYYQGTDGKKKDSDGDKTSDAEEILTFDTNAKDADSKPQKDIFKIVNLGSYIVTSGQSLLVQTVSSAQQNIHIVAINAEGKLQELAKKKANSQGVAIIVINDIPVDTTGLMIVDNEMSQVTKRSPIVFVQVKQVDLLAPQITKIAGEDARDHITVTDDKAQVLGETTPKTEVHFFWQNPTTNAALLADGKSGQFISRLAQNLSSGEQTLYAVAIGPHGERSAVTQLHFTYESQKVTIKDKKKDIKTVASTESNSPEGFLASVFEFGAKPQTLITAILLLVGIFCIRMGLKQRKQKLIAELVEEKRNAMHDQSLTTISIPNNNDKYGE